MLEKTLVHVSLVAVGWGTRSWLRYAQLVEVRASPDKSVLVHRTLPTRPDKTFWDLALSDIARQAPILSQTCLNSPDTSRLVKNFCRPTKNQFIHWLVKKCWNATIPRAGHLPSFFVPTPGHLDSLCVPTPGNLPNFFKKKMLMHEG